MASDLDLRHFFPDPASWAFFFDLDGTLAPLAERPELARVPETTIRQLADLHQAAAGALAVISGRPLETLDALLHPLVLPVGAEHGAIVRHAGGRIDPAANVAPLVHALATHVAQGLQDEPGVLLESKDFGLAVHYRLAPAAADSVQRLMESAVNLFPQFELLPGKMVVEAKLPGVNKGHALWRLMQESPFSGRKPLMVGDDTTDEAAFRQANALGGSSVKIGAGDTSAALRLGGQALLSGWLGVLLQRT